MMFVEVTGCSAESARKYISAAGGDLQMAIDRYLMEADAPPNRTNRANPPQPNLDDGASTPFAPPRDYVEDIFQRGHSQPPPAPGDVRRVKITFWKNGFIVDDGEFRPNDDPANEDFLRSVSKGMIPRELQQLGGEIDVEIEDNREKAYTPKPKPRDPWSGTARTLGGARTGGGAPHVSAAPLAGARTNFADPSKPTTKVKVQLTNGQLLLIVNTTATVRDLKSYIIQNQPQLKYSGVRLAVAFPPREITDDNLTIEQAGLKMAQVKVSTY